MAKTGLGAPQELTALGALLRPQHKDNLIPWPGALKSFSEAFKSFSRALKSFSEALKVGITLIRPLSRYPYDEACFKGPLTSFKGL